MESAKTTVCILNWKRQDNVRAILSALRVQQPAVKIFLWNNGPQPSADFAADMTIHSSANAMCPPRWWMACQARTQYVMVIDDDVCPSHPLAVDVLVGRASGRKIVGPFGAVWRGRYSDHQTVRFPTEDTAVDAVKGRCMAMETEQLRAAIQFTGVLQSRTTGGAYDDLGIAEDLAVCGAMAGGARGYHLVPAGLGECFHELPEGSEALSLRADHMPRRNAVDERWFK
jgi:hypothetical protein